VTVTCSRCGASNEIALGANRSELLCGNCYGPLDEDESKQADAYAAELEKLKPLTKSYGNKKD
jgi:hypothetical protein